MSNTIKIFRFLDINYFFIRPIFGMAFLAFVPGVLLMLALKIKKKIFWEAIVYVVGLSVTFLMFAGLITNWVLTNWKISEPLSTSHLIVVFNFFIIILLILQLHFGKSHTLQEQTPDPLFLLGALKIHYRLIYIFCIGDSQI